ncbi:MAG: SDR family oxidoreductase [Myxococcales bacterium]|nr:SDR family oxidoreductase [Myxococcales bacterium]
MRVFVTGGSGFIGSAVVRLLLKRGHEVLALARSKSAEDALRYAGADVHRGDLEDRESLTRGASECDGAIHMGFIHDFTRFDEVCAVDRQVVEALGAAARGSARPLVVTSGTALVSPGRLATEKDAMDVESSGFPRAATEAAALGLAAEGVRVSLVRLPPSVHGAGDHGFVPMLAELARRRGAAGYVGAGANRWCAVHREDAAAVFVGALERAVPGARYHAVAESEVRFKDLATVLGARLEVPVVSVPTEEAEAHFGWLAHFAALDCPAASASTRARLGWVPTHSTLLDDLASRAYFG